MLKVNSYKNINKKPSNPKKIQGLLSASYFTLTIQNVSFMPNALEIVLFKLDDFWEIHLL